MGHEIYESPETLVNMRFIEIGQYVQVPYAPFCEKVSE